jgi:hypothetical protein
MAENAPADLAGLQALVQQLTQQNQLLITQLQQQAAEPAPNLEAPIFWLKKALPDIPRFSGDRKDYRAWILEARNKLAVDAAAIGNPATQFAYIYSRMEAKAQLLTAPFAESAARNGNQNAQAFIAYLDSIFLDPN